MNMLYVLMMAACLCIMFGRERGMIYFSLGIIGALIWIVIDKLLT